MRFHARVSTLSAVFLILAGASLPAVAAMTPARIAGHFKALHRGCSVNTTVLGSGAVLGAPVPVTLVTLSVEGCAGSNMWFSELVGVYEQQGKLAVAKAPPTLGMPEKAVILDGRVVVSTIDYGPSDPRCCPSVHKSSRLVFSNGALVPG